MSMVTVDRFKPAFCLNRFQGDFMNLKDTFRHSKLASQTWWLICSFLLVVNLQPAHAQTPAGGMLNTNEAKRARATRLAMLKEMKIILEENYYDPTFRGMDLKARFQAAENRVKTLNYNWQIFRVLAQVLLDLDDSHTALIL